MNRIQAEMQIKTFKSHAEEATDPSVKALMLHQARRLELQIKASQGNNPNDFWAELEAKYAKEKAQQEGKKNTELTVEPRKKGNRTNKNKEVTE